MSAVEAALLVAVGTAAPIVLAFLAGIAWVMYEIPDLRLSAITRDPAAWDKIVRGGERMPRGMVSFATEVSSEDSEKVRAYVIHRAHETRRLEAAAPAVPASTPATDVPVGGPK